jgi:hypothetical protein
MPDVESVTLRNPRVIETLIRETGEGAGRNATETADNLILEAAEHRRVSRERYSSNPKHQDKANSERNPAKAAAGA